MKKDIPFIPVVGVSVVIVPADEHLPAAAQTIWQVYWLNENDFALKNVIVNANGYGVSEAGEKIRTSSLRHLFAEVPPHTAVPVEPLDSSLFHLNNQYWVSYFRGAQVFDKKFIFVPDSIVTANLTPVALLQRAGILHS